MMETLQIRLPKELLDKIEFFRENPKLARLGLKGIR